jgi:hypothetical protein
LRLRQSGHPVDSAKYRKQNEKITDKLRSMFEKATGKKVSFPRLVLSARACMYAYVGEA